MLMKTAPASIIPDIWDALWTRESYAAYLSVAALIAMLALSTVFAFNWVIDPLWYVRGNQITGVNFGFNERLSKTVRFLKNPEAYDCILFGSSRSAQVDVRRIARHRCYNFSFSAGTLKEYVAFASYLRDRAGPLEQIIVGLDSYNFSARPKEDNTPDFVRADSDPPSVLVSYLSYGAFSMARGILKGGPPEPRYYDREFVGRIVEDPPRYDPMIDLDTAPTKSWLEDIGRTRGPFGTENVKYLVELRRIFPEAEIVAYVPPISAYQIARIHDSGNLDGYVGALHAAAGHVDRLYDFTMPSDITKDTSLTYDGSHYAVAVMDRVVDVIEGRGAPGFGVDVKAMSADYYAGTFTAAARGFASVARRDHLAELPAGN